MIFPPLPDNEEQRLAEFLSYDILDTEAEALFDELTLLASQICDTPIALISLVDPDRQWFKSRIGLDATETSRNVAFCAHAILQKDVFEVSDASLDKRFSDNPLVAGDPNIRFYAGAPLMTPSGHAIGTLCAIDKVPKVLTDEQKTSLQTLGHAVMSHLELRRKNKEQLRINQFKSDFLAYVSHEIRTPLNAVNTFSELLLEEAEKQQLDDPFPSYLTHIHRSGERILTMINSVLDVKQLESGEMIVSKRPVNTHDFFTHLFTLMKVNAGEKRVTFRSSVASNIPATLELDDTKLGQIALNLIGNAIQYTPAGKRVSCFIRWENRCVVLEVVDEGIGISEEHQQALLAPFKQSDNVSHVERKGLGLVICQQLLRLMDGSIEITSELNKGTRVMIFCPADDASSAKTDADSEAYLETWVPPVSSKILVVEDNEINQIVVRAIFADFDLPVAVVSTGEEGVEYVRKHPTDLILMDINLPGISGTEATRQIKEAHPLIPIVALTADVVTEQERLLNSGLDEILSKPVDRIALKRALRTYLPDPQP